MKISEKWTKAKLTTELLGLASELDKERTDFSKLMDDWCVRLQETKDRHSDAAGILSAKVDTQAAEVKRLEEQVRGERDYAKRSLDSVKDGFNKEIAVINTALARKDREARVLLDLLVMIHVDTDC